MAMMMDSREKDPYFSCAFPFLSFPLPSDLSDPATNSFRYWQTLSLPCPLYKNKYFCTAQKVCLQKTPSVTAPTSPETNDKAQGGGLNFL